MRHLAIPAKVSLSSGHSANNSSEIRMIRCTATFLFLLRRFLKESRLPCGCLSADAFQFATTPLNGRR